MLGVMTTRLTSIAIVSLSAFIIGSAAPWAQPARNQAGACGQCQLTGDVDWETGQPTAARTLANFGLDAVDLGYPVEHLCAVCPQPLHDRRGWPRPQQHDPLAHLDLESL
jgi:hypothetical protein